MKAYYTDHFVLPLPAGHRFPMAKYAILRQLVTTLLPAVELLEPVAASDEELALAHDADYIGRVCRGGLSAAEQRAIGFPWSAQMVERSRRSVGATIAACRSALVESVAVSLAGGTHHAMHASGHGYCVFNDAVVAARKMQRDGSIERVAIIDLDVHQGDGTASIVRDDASIFAFSMHGESNFPFRKQVSDLDVALPDGTGDAEYLAALDCALDAVARRCSPQLLIYVAGADAHQNDRLGRLALTTEGMRERDARVFRFAAALGVPIAVTMAGGYGHDIELTAQIHAATIGEALQSWHRRRAPASPEQFVG